MKTKTFLLLFTAILIAVSSVTVQAQKLVQPGTWRNWKIYTGARDTLNNAAFGDTISAYAPAQKMQIVKVEIGDIGGNSKTDSSIVEVKGPTGTWVQVGAKNLLTGNTDAYLVPGDGKTGLWEVVAEYLGDYRIRRVNTSYTARIKSYVTFQAVSP